MCVLRLVQGDRDDMYDPMDDGTHTRSLSFSCALSVCIGRSLTLSHRSSHDCASVDYSDAKRSDPMGHRVKKVAYPPRLMVDFTSLGVRLRSLTYTLGYVSIRKLTSAHDAN